MALPVKGWPKHIGRGLRNRGGHLTFLYNRAWKPLNIETQNTRRRRPRWYRGGMKETSRDPPLTRAAMTRRQIAWIVNYPEQRSFPCYDVCSVNSDDDEFVDTSAPFVTTETERNLSCSYQDLGVSVTISGHRFIALTKDTSWIDNCKACGKVDAVEFITRCGAQKLCSRQCVQMLVRHRRYKRQIQERPLFIRPTSMCATRQREEEIILEKPPKRKYTRRQPPAASKAASKKVESDDRDGKPAKRAYVKKTHKSESKLKIKMQLNKTHSPTLKTTILDRSNSSTISGNDTEKNGQDVLKHPDKEITEQESCVNACDHSAKKKTDESEDSIEDDAGHMNGSTSVEVSKIKLGHVKIVLKKMRS